MLQIIVDTVKEHGSNRLQTAKLLQHNKSLLNEIQRLNQPEAGKNHKINLHEFTVQNLDSTIRHFGYKGWKDFKKKIHVYNHKVVKIEYVQDNMDVGTITIDGNEKWHDYHTFPVNGSIFVKNSIIEDYFFAQSAAGRGSRVETLPGGDGLADIDDLKYFNNKLVRGLSVPSSYLPTGPDDGTATYHDGRVGTAYMQEYRFAKYCQRLQSLLEPTFDREFKLFLRERGIHIDSSLFELRFQEPQNFAKFRQIELDSAQIGVFSSIAGSGADYIAKRTLLKKYLMWEEDEILENEELWKEENRDRFDKDPTEATTGFEGGGGLGAVGVGPPPGGDEFDEIGDEGLEGEELEPGEDGTASPISGDEGAPAPEPGPEEA